MRTFFLSLGRPPHFYDQAVQEASQDLVAAFLIVPVVRFSKEGVQLCFAYLETR